MDESLAKQSEMTIPWMIWIFGNCSDGQSDFYKATEMTQNVSTCYWRLLRLVRELKTGFLIVSRDLCASLFGLLVVQFVQQLKNESFLFDLRMDALALVTDKGDISGQRLIAFQVREISTFGAFQFEIILGAKRKLLVAMAAVTGGLRQHDGHNAAPLVCQLLSVDQPHNFLSFGELCLRKALNRSC